MRKIILTLGLSCICLTAILYSCKKQNLETKQTLKKPNISDYIMINDSSSIGEIHNFLLEKYYQQYGMEIDSVLTLEEFNLMRDRTGLIALVNGVFDDSSDLIVFKNIIDSINNDLGILNDLGKLKPLENIVPLILDDIHNTTLKNSIMDLYNNIYLGNDSMIYNSISVLNSMTGLNEDEQLFVGNFVSVYNHSSIYWQNFNGETNAMVSGVDAAGAARGWIATMDLGWSDERRMKFAGAVATFYSNRYRNSIYYA